MRRGLVARRVLEKRAAHVERVMTGRVPEWSADATYKVGDLVTHYDDLFECIGVIGTTPQWERRRSG